ARHQGLSGPQCRNRQGSYAVRADRRPRRVPQRQARPQICLGRRDGGGRRVTSDEPIFGSSRGRSEGPASRIDEGEDRNPLPFRFSLGKLTHRCNLLGSKAFPGAQREVSRMFARTPRLLLRPGWKEDAPAVAEAIGEFAVAGKLARVPWPYRIEDAEAWLTAD